jgi:hypothetical protein
MASARLCCQLNLVEVDEKNPTIIEIIDYADTSSNQGSRFLKKFS